MSLTSDWQERRLESIRIEEALNHAEMRQRTHADARRASLRAQRKPPGKDNEYRKPGIARGTGTTEGVK